MVPLELHSVQNWITSAAPMFLSEENAIKYSFVNGSADKNDPGRFLGEGVAFRAKLIGILEVGEARGDRMCQEALQDLKVAIRAAGEHKQRISVHVAIDGLRLRDEKTGDSLYHHPVHKISFIAQDMTDSRAFGYIFGSPDSGHRFFGIKTDKAASQVVIAMRDLFQVVFELKKKEIELARLQIHVKGRQLTESSKVQNGSESVYPISKMATIGEHKPSIIEPSASKMSPESIADLVDLEQELHSLQRGLNQMERLTPSDGPQSAPSGGGGADPFGDSFASFTPPPCLPPPPSTRTERLSRTGTIPVSPPFSPPPVLKTPFSPTPLHQVKSIKTTSLTQAHSTSGSEPASARSVNSPDWLQAESYTFEEPVSIDSMREEVLQSLPFDVFTELDPLGTGRSKPYIDKKHFFQELKNPPKKVLKDLVGEITNGCVGEQTLFQATFDSEQVNQHNNSMNTINANSVTTCETAVFEDPCEKTDPFADTNFKPHSDPFDTKLVGFKEFNKRPMNSLSRSPLLVKENILPETKISHVESAKDDAKENFFNGPLQVSLPPERGSSYITSKSPKLDRQSSVQNAVRNRPCVAKQNTVESGVARATKIKSHIILSQKFSKKDANSSQINMSRLQESDSLSESEAPEPPPRPENINSTVPPPLPPKKQFGDIVIRPPPRPPHAESDSHYDYIDSYNATTMEAYNKLESEKSPPLPVPARRSKFDDNFTPQRPKKTSTAVEDDYLTPITMSKRDARGIQSPKNTLERPVLLPPPQKKDGARSANKSEGKKDAPIKEHNTLDITLSDLLTCGFDELALKLGVPAARLSNMTLVELTTYLSNYLANANDKKPIESKIQLSNESPAIFKADFDNNTSFKTSFTANFDDDFSTNTFVADFNQFNQKNSNFDRYAVFREIQEEENKNKVTEVERTDNECENENLTESHESLNDLLSETVSSDLAEQSNLSKEIKLEKFIVEIDKNPDKKTNTTAADRYAALRDIILLNETLDPNIKRNLVEDQDNDDDNNINERVFEKGEFFDKNYFNIEQNIEISVCNELSKISLLSSKSPLNKSPLNISPIMSQSPQNIMNIETSREKSPQILEKSILFSKNSPNDNAISSQPVVVRSPVKMNKSPVQNLLAEVNQNQTRLTSGSLSDVISGSSPEIDNTIGSPETKTQESTPAAESWAIFDAPNLNDNPPKTINQSTSPLPPMNTSLEHNIDSNLNSLKDLKLRPAAYENMKLMQLGVSSTARIADSSEVQSGGSSRRGGRKCEDGLSPWSSDGKEFYGSPTDWSNREPVRENADRRTRRHRDTGWGKAHASSSSRDASPWEEEAPPTARRPAPLTGPRRAPAMALPNERSGYFTRHEADGGDTRSRDGGSMSGRRRRDSWEEDEYDYEDDSDRMNWPDRRPVRPTSRERVTRSRELLDSRVHPRARDYPDREYEERRGDFDERFDRKSFERRGSFDRDISRESFRDSVDRIRADHLEERFDREDRLYDRHQNFGSRELYGSDEREFDRESWEKYGVRRSEYKHGRKEHWMAAEREYESRFATVGPRGLEQRQRRNRGPREWGGEWAPPSDDYENESDGDLSFPARRLEQRRRRGPRAEWTESPGEEVPPADAQLARRPWKRPASASETDRRIDRRNYIGGSDGERDRRFRNKSRSRSRESQLSESRQPNKLEPTSSRGRGRHQRFEPQDSTETNINKHQASTIGNYQQEDFEQDDNIKSVGEHNKPAKHNQDVFFETDFNEEYNKNSFNFDSNFETRNVSKQKGLFVADFLQCENPSSLTGNTNGRYRFSNDFSEKESPRSINSLFENEFTPRKTESRSPIQETKINKFKFENDFSKDVLTLNKESCAEPGSPFKGILDIKQSFEDDFIPETNVIKIEFEATSEENDRKTENRVEFSFSHNKEHIYNTMDPVKTQKNILTKARQPSRDLHLKKSESVNIFARDVDPFDGDDFFSNSSSSVTVVNEKSSGNNRSADKTDPYKWSGTFDEFDE